MASLSLPKSRCRNDFKAATASSRDMSCALCLQCCDVLTDPTLPCDPVALCPSCRNAAYLCNVKPANEASRKGPSQCSVPTVAMPLCPMASASQPASNARRLALRSEDIVPR